VQLSWGLARFMGARASSSTALGGVVDDAEVLEADGLVSSMALTARLDKCIVSTRKRCGRAGAALRALDDAADGLRG